MNCNKRSKNSPPREFLSPDVTNFQREEVLVQAWKKAHAYIRRHNWIEDTLALDESAIDLKSTLAGWIEEWNKAANGVTSEPAKLLLAPKTSQWIVDEDTGCWEIEDKKSHASENDDNGPPAPESDDNSQSKQALKGWPLRPLSAITIRDQTYAVAFAMQLADIVETRQGDPRLDFAEAHNSGVISYGNRLFCDRSRGMLHFRWGNSTFYRQYYQDYQRFLERPLWAVRNLAQDDEYNESAIIELDLSKFYDRITPTQLRSRIQRLLKEHNKDTNYKSFTDAFNSFFKWKYYDEDNKLINKHLEKGLKSDDGVLALDKEFALPQGLVAAGFFSNIALVELDEAIVAIYDKWLPLNSNKKTWKILDYCRYVDDIRLVVTYKKDSCSNLTDEVITWFDGMLYKHTDDLKINFSKAKVVLKKNIDRKFRLNNTIDGVNQTISGPLDVKAATQVLDTLETLMVTSLRTIEKDDSNKVLPDHLANVLTDDLDMSADTLLRFSANRIRRVYKILRPLLPKRDMGCLKQYFDVDQLDEQVVRLSRRLVKVWFRDPSSVQALKVAFDLVQEPEVLREVLRHLARHLAMPCKISGNGDVINDAVLQENDCHNTDDPDAAYYISLYVAGEILRAGYTSTGRVRRPQEENSYSVPKKFRSILVAFAKCVLCHDFQSHAWNLQQHALITLFVNEARLPASMPGIESAEGSVSESLKKYINLVEIHSDYNLQHTNSTFISLYLYRQVFDNYDPAPDHRIIDKMTQYISKHKDLNEALGSLEFLLSEDEPLGQAVWKKLKALNGEPHRGLAISFAQEIEYRFQKDFEKGKLHGKYNLADIAHSPANPFHEEIPLLHFTVSLLDYYQKLISDTELAPFELIDFDISVKNWEKLYHPQAKSPFIEINASKDVKKRAQLKSSELPNWAVSDYWRFHIGQIIRSIASGNVDFTRSSSRRHSDLTGGKERHGTLTRFYNGVRSNWLKRRYGMFGDRGTFGFWSSTLSEWFLDRITVLLRWPGQVLPPTVQDVSDINMFKIQIQERLTALQKIYGTCSSTPFIPQPWCRQRERSKRKMRIAMVQSVVPKTKDLREFCAGGFSVNTILRMEHHLRGTLAALEDLLELRCTHINCTKSDCVDLIIMPELAVLPEHIPLMKRIMSRHDAGLFCGITLIDDPRRLPSSGHYVNAGLWILPEHFDYTDYEGSSKQFRILPQGKKYPTENEIKCCVESWRPVQWLIQMKVESKITCLSGSICYDATDLRLAADLRDRSDLYLISAHNHDITTYDNLVQSLQYGMYQHVVLVNKGEYGGSSLQAPYYEPHERTIVHHHGNEQVCISFAEVDLLQFRNILNNKNNCGGKKVKTHPASINRICP